MELLYEIMKSYLMIEEEGFSDNLPSTFKRTGATRPPLTWKSAPNIQIVKKENKAIKKQNNLNYKRNKRLNKRNKYNNNHHIYDDYLYDDYPYDDYIYDDYPYNINIYNEYPSYEDYLLYDYNPYYGTYSYKNEYITPNYHTFKIEPMSKLETSSIEIK